MAPLVFESRDWAHGVFVGTTVGSEPLYLAGFGQNLRVLLWMVDRIRGKASAQETPIGLVPSASDLDLSGMELSRGDLDTLLRVDRDEWASEVPEIRAFFDRFGDKLPGSLSQSTEALSQQLTTAQV